MLISFSLVNSLAMCTSVLKIFCLILIIQNFANADLELHSRCRTTANESGICTEVRKCKTVFDAIIAGTDQSNKPTVCSQQDQTVCCPIQSPLTVRSTDNRAAATTETNIEEKEITKVMESKMGELEEEMPLRDEAERISERSKN